MHQYEPRHVKSFLSSLYAFVKKDLGQFLPKFLIERRLEICQKCDNFDPRNNRCTICGCGCDNGLSIFNKLALPHEQCPHHPPKWGPINSEQLVELTKQYNASLDEQGKQDGVPTSQ